MADLQRSEPVNFQREVLPILRKRCLACHGQPEAESDVVLESPQTMSEADTDLKLIVPGSAEGSHLFAVASHRVEPFMPPEDNDVGASPLSPEELALVKLWIDQGAKSGAAAAVRAVSWRPLPARVEPTYAVAVSPQGDYVAAGRGRDVEVYHVGAKRLAAKLSDPALGEALPKAVPPPAHLDLVQSLAFSPDGRRLVSGGYRVAKLWVRDPAGSAEEIARAEDTSGALAASGDRLAVGQSGGAIRLYDAAGKKLLRTLEGHTATITGLAFSADGSRLASASRDGTCRVWQAEDGSEVASFASPSPRSVAWVSGDGQIAVGCEDGSVRVLDAGSGNQVRQLDHGGPVVALAATADGQTLLSAGANGIARLWKTTDGQKLADLEGDAALRRRAEAAKLNAEVAGRLAAAAKGALDAAKKTVTAGEEEIKKAREEVTKAEEELKAKTEAAAGDKPSDKAVAEKEAAQRVVEGSKTRLTHLEERLKESAQAVADAEQDVAEADRRAADAEAHRTECEKQASESQRPWTAAAWLPGPAAFVVADAEGKLHRFAADAAPLEVAPAEGSKPVALAASAGHLVALEADGRLVRSPAAVPWKLERTFGGGDSPVPVDRVTALAFSPDGKLLATGGGQPSREGEIVLWDVESGAVVRTLDAPHSDTVLGLAFSPDGRFLASASADRTMKVFRVPGGEPAGTFEGHSHHVLGVAWRADGRMLATAGADRTIKIWEFPSGKQLRTIEGFSKEVTSVGFLGTSDNILASSLQSTLTTKTSGGGGGPNYGGLAGSIYTAQSSAQGDIVAAGGQEGTLWVWKTGGQPIATFPPPP